MRVRQLENILGGHWDRHPVVEITRARHLGVDDERGVPWIATVLGPDEVERLKGDVHRRHARVVLVTARITIELKFFS